MRKNGELIELRLRTYNEHALLALGIYTIDEAIRLDFDWLASNRRVGPNLANNILDDIDKRYPIWQEHGMQYSGVYGVQDEPSPEEIEAKCLEIRSMSKEEYIKIFEHKSGTSRLTK
jgi:hypothetical protein